MNQFKLPSWFTALSYSWQLRRVQQHQNGYCYIQQHYQIHQKSPQGKSHAPQRTFSVLHQLFCQHRFESFLVRFCTPTQRIGYPAPVPHPIKPTPCLCPQISCSNEAEHQLILAQCPLWVSWKCSCLRHPVAMFGLLRIGNLRSPNSWTQGAGLRNFRPG